MSEQVVTNQLEPTTWIGTLTAVLSDQVNVGPGTDSADPYCGNNPFVMTVDSGHISTFVQFLTTLTDSQTQAIERYDGVFPPKIGLGSYYEETFTGPTIIYTTITTRLNFDVQGPKALPGDVCGGKCGICQLYFPTVYVYYWPVSSPNTACLGTPNSSLTAMDVQPRGLSSPSGNVSTIVNLNTSHCKFVIARSKIQRYGKLTGDLVYHLLHI